jgi:hypothetical protein
MTSAVVLCSVATPFPEVYEKSKHPGQEDNSTRTKFSVCFFACDHPSNGRLRKPAERHRAMERRCFHNNCHQPQRRICRFGVWFAYVQVTKRF